MFEGLKAIREEIENATITNPDRDEIRDGYQLRFVGKDYAKFVSTLPTETVLVPDKEWNNKAENKDSQNIFITGDNLDALKHLVNAYERQIKCIYIDPPYNTGSDGFVYNDTFNFTDAQLKEKLGMADSDVARLRALNGKCSHSAWLTFMLPRLVLAKRMLADDGAIFISIDDNEVTNLKLICDEIFGEDNFIALVPRLSSAQRPAQEKYISKTNDYIVVYTKHKQYDFHHVVQRNLTNLKHDDKGTYLEGDTSPILASSTQGYSAGGDYDIEFNGKIYKPVDSKGNRRRWLWTKDRMQKAIELGIVVETASTLRVRNYINKEFQVGTNILVDKDPNLILTTNDLMSSKYVNNLGTDNLRDLSLDDVFDFPKPVSLLEVILNLASDKNSLILDFFAGSSTTAHAVMQLNSEDKGNRKYIMVQLDEPVASGSEAEKAGYKTIDEISRDRIKLAADKIGDKSGFKHYKLAKISDNLVLDKIDTFDPTKPNLLADDMIKPFSGKDLGTKLMASGIETILTTWMVDDGYTLTTPIQEIKFGDYTAYLPKDSHRLYLISVGWTTDNTRELLNLIGRNELSVQTIIVYNHSFDFKTLTELKNNMKSVLEGNVEIIERF